MKTAIVFLLVTGCGEAFAPDFFLPDEDGAAGAAGESSDAGEADAIPDQNSLGDEGAGAGPGECELAIPAGTQVSASLSRPLQPPELSVDDDPATAWNAGASSAQVSLTLPELIALSAISLLVTASPDSQGTYLVSALRGGVWSEVGRGDAFLADRQATVVTVSLPAQQYQSLRIGAYVDPSHAAIYEIGLVGACP